MCVCVCVYVEGGVGWGRRGGREGGWSREQEYELLSVLKKKHLGGSKMMILDSYDGEHKVTGPIIIYQVDASLQI